jgi:hypothetical protein
MSDDVFTDMIEDEPEPINDMTTPSFALTALLSGQHNDLLRELAAKSLDKPDSYWWCPGCLMEKSPVQVSYEERCTKCGHCVEWIELPNFPASLDACHELLAALTDEELRDVAKGVAFLNKDKDYDKRAGEWDVIDVCNVLRASPIQILVAFCLTRNLIRIVVKWT